MFKKTLMLIAMLFLLFSCSIKDVKKQESAFIVIKTDKLKFADMGFIYEGKENLKVEMYAAGQAILDLDINSENICLSLFECMDKQDFNNEVLSSHYPAELLENIFRSQPIFESKNLEKKEGGFTQKITKENKYDISYSVISGKRIFRDKINNILIKVRKQ